MPNNPSDEVKDYVVLDIENPNTRCASVCSVAVLRVRDGRVTESLHSLIDPEDRFDIRNTEINGITASDVHGAPTLKAYWPVIRDALCDNVVVGHNIKYDLCVISKSLARYGIKPPVFAFLDTLELSRHILDLDSYKLSNISKYIGYSYKEHDALEDAEAAHNLFEYLRARRPVTQSLVRRYRYTAHLRTTSDSQLETALNDLHGIIKGIAADGIVNAKEVLYLKKWADDNSKYKEYELFANILGTLEIILRDGVVDDFERQELETLAVCVKTSRVYSESTLAVQVLNGILKGIASDRDINEKELASLKRWLDINDYLSGVYPYDKVCLAVKEVLADGVVTSAEKARLLEEFDDILNPVHVAKDGAVEFAGKTFCLTGEFKCGSKDDVSRRLCAAGGIEKKSVTKSTDCLVVGSLGSQAWKYGSAGGKIARAKELIDQGVPIQIIAEESLSAVLS